MVKANEKILTKIGKGVRLRMLYLIFGFFLATACTVYYLRTTPVRAKKLELKNLLELWQGNNQDLKNYGFGLLTNI